MSKIVKAILNIFPKEKPTFNVNFYAFKFIKEVYKVTFSVLGALGYKVSFTVLREAVNFYNVTFITLGKYLETYKVSFIVIGEYITPVMLRNVIFTVVEATFGVHYVKFEVYEAPEDEGGDKTINIPCIND